jgi:hypothetical protein
MDGGVLQGAHGRTPSEEKLSERNTWATVSQILGEDVAGLIGEWKAQVLPRFCLDQVQNACTPVDVVESQSDQLATSKAVPGCQV